MKKSLNGFNIISIIFFVSALVFCFLPFFSFSVSHNSGSFKLDFSPFDLMIGEDSILTNEKIARNPLIGVGFFLIPLIGIICSFIKHSYLKGITRILIGVVGAIHNVAISALMPNYIYYGESLENINNSLIDPQTTYLPTYWVWISSGALIIGSIFALITMLKETKKKRKLREIEEYEYFLFAKNKEEAGTEIKSESKTEDKTEYLDVDSYDPSIFAPPMNSEFSEEISDIELMRELDLALADKEDEGFQ